MYEYIVVYMTMVKIIERVDTAYEKRLRDVHFDGLQCIGRIDVIGNLVYKTITEGKPSIIVEILKPNECWRCDRCFKPLSKCVIICRDMATGRVVHCGVECGVLVSNFRRDDQLTHLFQEKWRFKAGVTAYMYKNIKIRCGDVDKAFRPFGVDDDKITTFTLVRGVTKHGKLWFRFGPDRLSERGFWKSSKVLFTNICEQIPPGETPDVYLQNMMNEIIHFITNGEPR